MNTFHSAWRVISAHEITSTIGKKIANSTVGKSNGRAMLENGVDAQGENEAHAGDGRGGDPERRDAAPGGR